MLLEIVELTAQAEPNIRSIHGAVGDSESLNAAIDLLASELDGFVMSMDDTHVISCCSRSSDGFRRFFFIRVVK